MTDFPSYAYGTVTIEAGGTVITGTDTNWSGVNARAGDDFKVYGHTVDIVDVIDETHLKIDAWPYDAVTDAEYKIIQRSPLRFVGGVARADLTTLLSTLKAKGLLWYLPDGLTEPNDAKPPLTADENQGILDITTKQLWVMQGGAWVSAGSFSGFGSPQDYNAGTTYHPLDIVIKDGTVYVVKATTTGNAPPNATYYGVIAPAGVAATVDVGATTTLAPGASATVTPSGTSNARILNFGIPTGKGYGGTSTTSMTIGTGNQALDLQAGLAFVVGDRVHIGAVGNELNWMEGFVTAYSGTSMTVAVSDVGGSGTYTSWGIGLTGKPGAGDGDMKGANNLSDLSDIPVARANLLGRAIPLITDFGDVDDSGTEDAASAFRWARDELPNGSTVCIPNGEWLLDSIASGEADIIPFTGGNGNKSISFEGMGWQIKTGTVPGQPYAKPTGSILKIGSSIPDTANVFRWAGTDHLDRLSFRNFAIIPYNGALGTPKGKNGIFIDATGNDDFLVSHLSCENVYIDNMATGVSFRSKAELTSNSGGLAYSVIRDSRLMCIALEYVGDSMKVEHNVIGYNCTSDNPGIYAHNITGAAGFTERDNNIANTYGPLVVFDGGTSPVFDNEELEYGNGLVNRHGTLLHLRGGASIIYGATVLGGTHSQNNTRSKIRPLLIDNAAHTKIIAPRINQGAYCFVDNVTLGLAISIASPCVVTWPYHGFDAGDQFSISTTGVLPTGLPAGTYYVKTVIDQNTFTVSATVGGAAINTSGTQSGAHTAVVPQAKHIVVGATAVSTRIFEPTAMDGGTLYTNPDSYLSDKGTDTRVVNSVEGVWTPTVTPSSGALGAYTAVGKFINDGKWTRWEASITITDNGTAPAAGTAAGSMGVSLPYATGVISTASGAETTISGLAVKGFQYSPGAIMNVNRYDNSYPGGTGAVILLSGQYLRA
jgi:hypothetical protein